jgi:hypothetical protein
MERAKTGQLSACAGSKLVKPDTHDEVSTHGELRNLCHRKAPAQLAAKGRDGQDI